MALPQSLSPFRLLNLSITALSRDAASLYGIMALIQAANSALSHLLFEGKLDAQGWPSTSEAEYWFRYAIFILIAIVMGGYVSCVMGRIVLNRFRNSPEPLPQILREALRRFIRSAWLFLPLGLVTYLLSETVFLLSLPTAYILTFFTPGMTLDGKSLKTSWSDGVRMTKASLTPLLMTFGLQAACQWIMITGGRATQQYLTYSLPPLIAGDLTGLIWMIPNLVLIVWGYILYAAAFDAIIPQAKRTASFFD